MTLSVFRRIRRFYRQLDSRYGLTSTHIFLRQFNTFFRYHLERVIFVLDILFLVRGTLLNMVCLTQLGLFGHAGGGVVGEGRVGREVGNFVKMGDKEIKLKNQIARCGR